MMRIPIDSPALTAVRSLLAGVTEQPAPRSGRSGRRKASRTRFSAERLKPRMMLDGAWKFAIWKTVMVAAPPDLADESDTGSSTVDNLTSDRTPALSGSVQGGASEVRVRIDGKRVAVVSGLACFDLALLVQVFPDRRQAIRLQLSRWVKQGKVIHLRRGM